MFVSLFLSNDAITEVEVQLCLSAINKNIAVLQTRNN